MVKGYWLQIGKEFINDLFVKKLRRIQGNNNLPFIYAKILYLSIENEGNGTIEFEHVEETFQMELAMALDEKEEEINVIIENAITSGKVEQDGDIFYFPDAHKYTNLKTPEAQRMERSRKKKLEQQSVTSESKTDETKPKKTAKPKKSVNPEVKALSEQAVSYLNTKLGTRYRPDTSATLKLVSARMNDGYGLEDFKAVIDVKTDEWVFNPSPNTSKDMAKYAVPNTLFGPKFEMYREQARMTKPKGMKTLEEFYARPEELPPELQGDLSELEEGDWGVSF